MFGSIFRVLFLSVVVFLSFEFLSRVVFYFVPKAMIYMNIPFPKVFQEISFVMLKNVAELRELNEEIAFTIPHKELGYVLKPNHRFYIKNPYGQNILYETKDIFGDGEFGLRDDGIDKEIFSVAIGDSFTFCMHLELSDCWVEIIENELDFDVINAGVYGWGTYQELLMLKKVLQKLGDKSKKVRYIFWQITFTDYQDDLCFLEAKMCNIFSPLFIYTPAGGEFVNRSFFIGLLLSIYDVLRFRFSYKEIPREPDEKNFKEAETICQNIGCKILIIYSYRAFVKPKLCSKYRCVYPRYEEDMFIVGDRHHNPKGSRFLARQIIDLIRNEREL